MKKIVWIIVACFISNTMMSQDFKLGFQYSLLMYGARSDTFSPTTVDDVVYSNAEGIMASFRTGITVQYKGIKHLGLETGILVDALSWKFAQTSNPYLGTYKGNTMHFNFKAPLLAYYKLFMPKGGSFILGGGINFDYLVSGVYRWRDGQGVYHKYNPITSYDQITNRMNQSYQVIVGIEDSENSQVRLTYGHEINSIFRKGNKIYPFYFGISLIRHLN